MTPTQVWEIRDAKGRAWVRSPIPHCGYDRDTLRSLKAAGFKLYCDGKAVKM